MGVNIFQEFILGIFFVNLANDLVFHFKKTSNLKFDIKNFLKKKIPCASLNSTLQMPKLFNFNFEFFFSNSRTFGFNSMYIKIL